MSELISGKEAMIALANGEEVELQTTGDMNWYDSTQWTVGELLCFKGRFRLKPRSITINSIEVPAPFEPKIGEYVYFISSDEVKGYAETTLVDTEMNWGVCAIRSMAQRRRNQTSRRSIALHIQTTIKPSPTMGLFYAYRFYAILWLYSWDVDNDNSKRQYCINGEQSRAADGGT